MSLMDGDEDLHCYNVLIAELRSKLAFSLQSCRAEVENSNPTSCTSRPGEAVVPSWNAVHQTQPRCLPLQASLAAPLLKLESALNALLLSNSSGTDSAVRPRLSRLGLLASLLRLHDCTDAALKARRAQAKLASDSGRFADHHHATARAVLLLCSVGQTEAAMNELRMAREQVDSKPDLQQGHWPRFYVFLGRLAQLVAACMFAIHVLEDNSAGLARLRELFQLMLEFKSYFATKTKEALMAHAEGLLCLLQMRYLTGAQGDTMAVDEFDSPFVHSAMGARSITHALLKYHFVNEDSHELAKNNECFQEDAWLCVDLHISLLCTLAKHYSLQETGCEAKVWAVEALRLAQANYLPHRVIALLHLMAYMGELQHREADAALFLSRVLFVREHCPLSSNNASTSTNLFSSSKEVLESELDGFHLPKLGADFQFHIDNATLGSGSSPQFEAQKLRKIAWPFGAKEVPWLYKAAEDLEGISLALPHLIVLQSGGGVDLAESLSSVNLATDDMVPIVTPPRKVKQKMHRAPKKPSDMDDFAANVDLMLAGLSARSTTSHSKNPPSAAMTAAFQCISTKRYSKKCRKPLRSMPIEDPEAAPRELWAPHNMTRRSRALRKGEKQLLNDLQLPAVAVDDENDEPEHRRRSSVPQGAFMNRSTLPSPENLRVCQSLDSLISQLDSVFHRVNCMLAPASILRRVCGLLAVCHLEKGCTQLAAFYLSRALGVNFGRLYYTNLYQKCRKFDCPLSRKALVALRSADISLEGWQTAVKQLTDDHCSVIMLSLVEVPASQATTDKNERRALILSQLARGGLQADVRVLHGFQSHRGAALLESFQEIMRLNLETMFAQPREAWWYKRFELDTQLSALLHRVADEWLLNAALLKLHDAPVLFIIDCPLQGLPWERVALLQSTCTESGAELTRLPSLSVAIGHAIVTSPQAIVRPSGENTFYVLDPDGSLPNTRKIFSPLFGEYRWSGIVQRKPKECEIERAIDAHEMYVYCGHGSGTRYIRAHVLQAVRGKASSLLIGCSSGRLIVEGVLEAYGVLMHHLMAGCRLVVANLWDVTDRDIDRFLAELLRICVDGFSAANKTSLADQRSLAAAVLKANLCCKMRRLVGYAPVAYGLPVRITID